MRSAGLVACAAGLVIAPRGANPTGSTHRVGPVAPVAVPPGPPVEAHRIDGVVWRRHWSDDARDLVIDFVGVTRVAVGTDGTVTFADALPADVELHLLLDHVLPLVLARRGLVVVHGGLISRAGAGVVVVGSSGAGKSTLCGHAWRSGWTLGGDDGTVLLPGPPPSAQATYPTLRLDRDGTRLLGLEDAPSDAAVGKRRFHGEGATPFCADPVAIALVAILEPVAAGEPAAFGRLGGIDAHAELFGSTFHAEMGGRLLPGVVDTLATVVEHAGVGRLTVPRGRDGLVAACARLDAELGAAPARGPG